MCTVQDALCRSQNYRFWKLHSRSVTYIWTLLWKTLEDCKVYCTVKSSWWAEEQKSLPLSSKTYSFFESNHIYLQQRWLISTAPNCWDIYRSRVWIRQLSQLRRKNRQGVLCNIVENLLLTVRAHSYLLYRYCRLVIHNHLTLWFQRALKYKKLWTFLVSSAQRLQ